MFKKFLEEQVENSENGYIKFAVSKYDKQFRVFSECKNFNDLVSRTDNEALEIFKCYQNEGDEPKIQYRLGESDGMEAINEYLMMWYKACEDISDIPGAKKYDVNQAAIDYCIKPIDKEDVAKILENKHALHVINVDKIFPYDGGSTIEENLTKDEKAITKMLMDEYNNNPSVLKYHQYDKFIAYVGRDENGKPSPQIRFEGKNAEDSYIEFHKRFKQETQENGIEGNRILNGLSAKSKTADINDVLRMEKAAKAKSKSQEFNR